MKQQLPSNVNSTTSHGVLLVVFDCGVLLIGESSFGKSSLALELIKGGHRLVADDAPLWRRTGRTQLVGSCPDLLQNLLAVPGLGVVDIRAIYGSRAIARQHSLDLVIRLTSKQRFDPLSRSLGKWKQLGIQVPEITLPVSNTTQGATIVETAVQDYLLRLQGYDALLILQRRQQAMMQSPSTLE
jgi:HPr kinase/phosphorylase